MKQALILLELSCCLVSCSSTSNEAPGSASMAGSSGAAASPEGGGAPDASAAANGGSTSNDSDGGTGDNGAAGHGAVTGNAGQTGSGGGNGDAGVALPDQDAAVTPLGTPVFVAVGYGGRRIRSLDGSEWIDDVIVDPNGGDDENLLRGVGWGDGQFLAVGGSIFSSSDGAAWQKLSFDPASFVADVVYSNGTWVLAGGNGLRARSLDGAETWIDSTPNYAGHYRDIAAGNGSFVAVGHTTGGTMVGLSTVSSDGADWSAPQTGGSQLWSVAFGNGVFVAVGVAGRVSVSTDGSSWDDTTFGTETRTSIAFVNDQFVIPNASGVAYSNNGQNWEAIASAAPQRLAYGNGIYAGFSAQTAFHGASLSTFVSANFSGPNLLDIQLGYAAE